MPSSTTMTAPRPPASAAEPPAAATTGIDAPSTICTTLSHWYQRFASRLLRSYQVSWSSSRSQPGLLGSSVAAVGGGAGSGPGSGSDGSSAVSCVATTTVAT